MAAALGDRRLCGFSDNESRCVGLLIANYTQSEVELLATVAQEVWRAAFGQSLTRVHKRRRIDAGISRRDRPGFTEPKNKDGEGTERAFLKRLRAPSILINVLLF